MQFRCCFTTSFRRWEDTDVLFGAAANEQRRPMLSLLAHTKEEWNDRCLLVNRRNGALVYQLLTVRVLIGVLLHRRLRFLLGIWRLLSISVPEMRMGMHQAPDWRGLFCAGEAKGHKAANSMLLTACKLRTG